MGKVGVRLILLKPRDISSSRWQTLWDPCTRNTENESPSGRQVWIYRSQIPITVNLENSSFLIYKMGIKSSSQSLCENAARQGRVTALLTVKARVTLAYGSFNKLWLMDGRAGAS